MSYHIGSQSVVGIPIYIRHNITFKDIGGGRLDITVGPRQTVGRTVGVDNYLQAVCNKLQNLSYSTIIFPISGRECSS